MLCLAAAAAAPAFAQEPAPASAAGAPAPELEQILVAGEYRYARSRRAGVFVSFDQGFTWQSRSAGLPHRVVYPFPDPPEFAAVTSLTADPANPRRLAATTASGLYLTTNGGMTWQRFATESVHPHAYFTSVALSPHDPDGMLLGTSFHGIYETTDSGATWQHLTPAIRFLTDRSLFYEEVAGLSYDPAQPRAMVVLAGFDGGVFYVANRFGEQRESPGTGLLRFPVPAMATIQIGYAPAGPTWELHAGTVDARWRLTVDGTWAPIGEATPLRPGAPLQPPEPAPPPAPVEPAPDTTTAPPTAGESASDTASTPRAAGDPASASMPPQEAGDSAPDTTPAPQAAGNQASDTVTPQAASAPAPDTASTAQAAGDPASASVTPQAAGEPASDTATALAATGESGQPATPPPDTEAAATAAGDAAQPQDATGSAAPAPRAAAKTPRQPASDSDQTVAAADSGAADKPEQDHRVASVSGFAPGLPQAPPPECTMEDHADEDSPAPRQQPAGEQAVAEQPADEHGAAEQTATAHADAQPGTAQYAASASATDHLCDEHMLAAGEPGWIPGPEGIGAAAPLQHAALRNGIYIRSDRAAAALPEYLDLLREHDLDSIVIDFKTDDGRLSYDSDLPLARAIGAAPGPIKLDRLIADAHAAGIYVIARLVVFKDPFLYDWDTHRVAIWDREFDEPWRHLVPAGDDSGDKVQREYWVDPFAPEVWQYNVAVAEELAARGVDEIQFDYIRFPSDGPTERATYRHRRPGMRRVDAIESFLALARERLEVPISTDLFGFNSWYRAGNFIGQDIDVLSEYADVISPMFYPSHFPDHFLGDRSYIERAYAIYETGVRRAQRMVRGKAHIRPYVQAFLIGRELRMEEDEYSRYLTRQLDGNRAAAGSGFTLWNASNRYYMVTEPLQPYFDTRGEETP